MPTFSTSGCSSGLTFAAMPWSSKRRSEQGDLGTRGEVLGHRPASQRARSAARRSSPRPPDTCWWSSANCSQTSDGSASSINCSASSPIRRNQSHQGRTRCPTLQVGHPVVERDLPAGGALLELVGPTLGPGQLGDQGLQALEVLLHGQLGLHPGAQLLGHGQHVLAGGAAVQVVGPGHHPAQQELDQLPASSSSVAWSLTLASHAAAASRTPRKISARMSASSRCPRSRSAIRRQCG